MTTVQEDILLNLIILIPIGFLQEKNGFSLDVF